MSTETISELEAALAAEAEKPAADQSPAEGEGTTSGGEATATTAQTAEREAKMVPIDALHEARAQAKEQAARAARMEERFQEIVTRLATQQQAPAAAPAEKVPEFHEDPALHLDARLRKIEAIADQAVQERQMTTAQAQQWQEQQRAMAAIQSQETQFAATRPDYYAAIQHNRMTRDRELAEHYGVADPAQRLAVIQQEELFMARNNIAAGANPAEKAYQLAVARGFKGAANGAGSAATQQLQTLQQGQNAAKSLSTAGGKPEAEMTLERLADLTGPDFEKAFDAMIRSGGARGPSEIGEFFKH